MTFFVEINKCCQVKLKTCFVLHIGFLLSIYKPEISSGAKCGRPGRTVTGTYRPNGDAFNESDVIQYMCVDKDHVILGSSERTCQRNGTWSDEIPVCSELAHFDKIELLFQEPEKGILNSIDGNISTCSEAPKYNRTVWRGYLSTSINISAVRISILDIRDAEVDIKVQDDDSPIGRRCTAKREHSEFPMKSASTYTFYCPAGTVGKYVHVTCNNQALRICEVSVLLPPASICLSPDVPLNGNGFKKIDGKSSTYQFKCNDGYKRWGELYVTCQADGRWSPKSPVCEEIYCPPPNELENGNVEYSLNMGKVPYNGIAKYTCKEGFYLDGHSTITCHRWHEWDFPTPVCMPRILDSTAKSEDIPVKEGRRLSNVTVCGNLPHIANGVLIVNSSHVGSTAWLKCSEGFKPLTVDHISCLPSGKWSSQSLRCTIIQCEANPIVPFGKATLLNRSSYYGSHLEIQCNQGYTSQTPIMRKCNELGTWGDLNICVEITCGATTTDEFSHDEWLHVNGSTDIRVLICPEDFHIEGSPAVIRCLSNGSWSYTSATCKRSFANFWGSSWTPSLILIAAIGAGVVTAILILCLSMAFLVIRKRQQSQTNTTVFHLESMSHKDGMGQRNIHRQNHSSLVENYKNEIENRPHSVSTNPRKSHSALPNLPVDADPVYAQPFETATVPKKTSVVTTNKKDDIYNSHIYAEPVDSRRQTSSHTHMPITLSRIGTDKRISTIKTNSVYESPTSVQTDQQNYDNIKTNSVYESPTSVQTDQQNYDKTCAIYNSSSHSTLDVGQLTSEEKQQTYNRNSEFGTLTNNLDYLELL